MGRWRVNKICRAPRYEEPFTKSAPKHFFLLLERPSFRGFWNARSTCSFVPAGPFSTSSAAPATIFGSAGLS